MSRTFCNFFIFILQFRFLSYPYSRKTGYEPGLPYTQWPCTGRFETVTKGVIVIDCGIHQTETRTANPFHQNSIPAISPLVLSIHQQNYQAAPEFYPNSARPWYSLRIIFSISSGLSLQPPASHIFTIAFNPLLKNSTWYSICWLSKWRLACCIS